jgi:L-asparaginase II
MSPPPILARVWRGDRVESVHRGSVAIVDEDGRLIAGAGAPRGGIYLRSAAKPFQAMPLLEAGGDKAFRLGRYEIALLCASHGGEPRHVRVAARILDRGGFSAADLACGADMPMHEPSARALIAAGKRPTALHNNCSGKHAGLLLACRLYGFAPAGYWKPRHPLQRLIRKRLGDFCGVPVARVGFAVDGCSLPVFHLPLSRLAFAYARLVAAPRPGESPDPAVRRRLCAAMWDSPGMVAGRGRFTTEFLEAGRGRWIGKEGAEGVYALGLAPRRGEKALGIAFMLEDGSTRARDAVALDVLARLGRLPASARRLLSRHLSPVLHNVRGLTVGSIEADVPLEDVEG